MTYSATDKAKDLATGAGIGAATNAAVVGTLAVSAKVVPAVAAGAKMLGPIGMAATATLALVGAARAALQSGKPGDVVAGAAAGSIGYFPDFTPPPAASPVSDDSANGGAKLILAADRTPTIAERQKELAEKNGAGGDPEVFKKISENSRKQMEKAGSTAERNAQERRALLAEEKYEAITGKHIGPTSKVDASPAAPAAAAPAPAAQSGVTDTLGQIANKALGAFETAVFGDGKPKAPDQFDQQRQVLDKQISDLSTRRNEAFKHGGGIRRDPSTGKVIESDYDRIGKELEKLTGERARVDTDEREANEATSQLYRSAGALAAGLVVGHYIGKSTVETARETAAVAEKGIASAAKTAGEIVKSNPRGVIKGTVAGDKAAAAVSSAAAAKAAPAVAVSDAYALPAVGLAHGAGMYAFGEYREHEAAKDGRHDPLATVFKTEGAFGMGYGLTSLKGAIAARSTRPRVKATDQAKLTAADNRLTREGKRGGGPAAVAQSKGSIKATEARSGAAVARVNAKGEVAIAEVRGAGRVIAAGHDTAARVGRAASRAEIGRIKGKFDAEIASVRGERAVGKVTGQSPKMTAEAKERVTYKTGKAHTHAEIAAYQARSVRVKANVRAATISKDTVAAQNDNAATLALNAKSK